MLALAETGCQFGRRVGVAGQSHLNFSGSIYLNLCRSGIQQVGTGGLTGDQQVSSEPEFHLCLPEFVARRPEISFLSGLSYIVPYAVESAVAGLGRWAHSRKFIVASHGDIVAKLAQMCKGVAP